MFYRVVIVTFLLGVAAFVQIKGTRSLPTVSLFSLYQLITLTYFLTFIYLLFLKAVENVKINIQIQTFCDVALITWLVHVTGGIESIYSIFYPLVVIYAVLFLGSYGGILIASACSVFYGLLLVLGHNGVVSPVYGTPALYHYGGSDVFFRIFLHVVSFYMVAVLANFVVYNERKLRLLLAEKEDAFAQLDLLHRSIIESVDTGIATFNLQGEIKSLNRAAEEIMGVTTGEVKGWKIGALFPGFRDPGEAKPVAARKGVRERFELCVDRGALGKQILGFATSPLIDGGGQKIGSILVFQDLTSFKEMEKQIERTKRLSLIGEMTACFAHEMRNPLASISGSIQILKRDLKLDEKDERLMQIVLRGKDQLETLLRDFLLLARPGIEDRREVDVNALIQDVLESIRYSPEWREGMEVAAELADDGTVYGNESEIRQALWNLAHNALQAMPGGGRMDVSTGLFRLNGREYLEIKVADQGCGIEEKDLAKVFEPFYTTKEKGTGLGLAIVSRIVESHQGMVMGESQPGRGSSFTMRLPKNG